MQTVAEPAKAGVERPESGELDVLKRDAKKQAMTDRLQEQL